jgi:hypothetical protein
MVINLKDYADFKKVVAAMRYVDGVFYNLKNDGSGSIPPGTSGYFVAAFCREDGIGVQVTTSTNPTDATVLSDFPQAQAVNGSIDFSQSSATS